MPTPIANVDFDTTLAITGSPLLNEPRSSRAYGLTHTPQRCLCAAYRNSSRRLRRSKPTLSPLGPHNGDYLMLTTERSDALGQLRSDVACCR